VKFPKKLDENKQIKLSMDGYNIDWNLLGIGTSNISYDNTEILPSNMKELIHINQSILYSNIQPNVDLEYILTGSKVKENIILNQYVENFSMIFEYKLKDLSLIPDENGNTVFINEDNEIVFSFSDLIMLDNESNMSTDIEFELIDKGNKTYQVTITPSDPWLQTAVYPVEIDPTIINNYQTANISDTYVSKSSPSSNFHNDGVVFISYYLESMECRGLLSFDIPSAIMHEEIVHATLSLTANTKTSGRIIGLYKNDTSFSDSTVTWLDKPTHSSSMTDYHVTGSDNNYIFDITKPVKEWQATGNPETTGFTIKDKYDYGAINTVKSLETTTTSSKPVIEFTYIKSSGMKDYWTYSEQNVGSTGSGYVSDFTGKLIFIKDELSFSTDKQSFGLSLIYNIDRKNVNIGYGLGWQTNYSMTYEQIVSNEEYAVIDGTGNTVHYYHTTCDNRFVNDQYNLYRCYLAEDGSGNIFFTNYYGSYLTTVAILTMDQMQYTFSSNRLSQITNTRTGININIVRNGTEKDKIESITDESGNRIELTYLNGRLDYSYLKIKQPNNSLKILEYIKHYYTYRSAYTDYALYYSKKYADYDNDTAPTVSPTSYYITDSSARITSVYSIYGSRVTYTYDPNTPSSDKIWTIKQYTDSSGSYLYSEIDYDYQLRKTTLTDQNGDYVIYKFDNYGHTVNILDNFGYSQSFAFVNLFSSSIDESSKLILDGEPNYYFNHLLVSKSDPIKSTENVIKNHSFETSREFDNSWILDQTYYSNQNIDSKFQCDIALFGDCSARLYASNSTYFGSYKQTVILDYGVYTLSGYIKNDTTSDYISFSVTGDVTEYSSDYVDNDEEWHYVTVIVDVDFDNTPVTIELNSFGVGYTYFDDIQLIEGFRDTRKNIIENPSFEDNQIDSWYKSTGMGIYTFQTNNLNTDLEEDILGDYAVAIHGSALELRSLSQGFTNYLNTDLINGKLAIGGWAYANAAPISVQSTDENDEVFRIRVDILDSEQTIGTQGYLDALQEPSYYIDFDASIEGWQFKLEEIPFEDGYFIYLSLEFQGEGVVFFDQIQMYYEGINNNYDYDIQGRMITSQSSTGDTTEYMYENSNDSRPTQIVSGPSLIELGIEDESALIETVTYNNVTSEQSFNTYGQITGTLVGDTSDYFTTSTTYLSTAFTQYLSTITNEFNDTTYYYTNTLTGLLTAIENANGDDLLYIYDDEGKLIKSLYVDSYTSYNVGDPYYSMVEYQYDYADRLDLIILERNSSGVPTLFYDLNYDPQNRISQVKVNSQPLMTYAYETDGSYITDRISTQTYGNGDIIEFAYDDENQIIGVNFNYITRFTYEYDQSGLVAVYNEHDSIGDISKTEYYTYDTSGRLKQMVDSENKKVEYAYDTQGNLINLEFSINDVNHSVDYYNNSCLVWYPYAVGVCTQSSTLYDKTEYTTQDEYDVSVRYIYETGALKRLNNINTYIDDTLFINRTNQFWGDTIRLSNITYNISGESADYKYTYSYDDVGNIIIAGYYEDDVIKTSSTYEYDELNQLIVENVREYALSVNNLQLTNYTKYFYYDSRGNITDIMTFLYGQDDYTQPTIPSFYQQNYGSYNATMTYNTYYDYQDIKYLNIGQSPTLSFIYYDTVWQEQIFGMTTTMTYNNLDTSTAGYYYRDYSATNSYYDLEFRIVFKVGNPVSGPTTPQEHIQFNYDLTWKDQLTGYSNIEYINGVAQTGVNVQEYTYDVQGNPIDITQFQYDGDTYEHATLVYFGRQLMEINIYNDSGTLNLEVQITYTYNDQGYRTSKTIGNTTTEYFLQGDKVIYETNGTYGIIYTYDHDGTLISFNYDFFTLQAPAGIEYYYVRNQQGDVTKIVDKNGVIVVEYAYDAWGNLIDIDGSLKDTIGKINPYRYRGYRYDAEISLYYLNSRYYDANIGRFLSADGLLGSIGNNQSTNMYAYCANNPVMYTDSDGYFWNLIVGTAIGAAVGSVSSIALQLLTTGGIDYRQVLLAACTGAISGFIASTGIGMIGSSYAGFLIGGLQDTASQLIANGGDFDSFNVGSILFSAGIGGFAGLISGGGYQTSKAYQMTVDLGDLQLLNGMMPSAQLTQQISSIVNNVGRQAIRDFGIVSLRYGLSVGVASSLHYVKGLIYD